MSLKDAGVSAARPEEVTTDGGPPYRSQEMAKYSNSIGFYHRITMPEDAQANGFAEAFVKVLVQLIHTTVVEGTDLLCMVNR